jgi:hypothetical protein
VEDPHDKPPPSIDRRDAAELDNADAPPRAAVLERQLLEHDDAMRQTLELPIRFPAGVILE